MFKRADVVVGALDNREARLHLNRLAWRVGVPWIDGAMEALLGVARVFRPPDSCYECTLSEADWAAISHRQSCRLLTREEMLTGKVPTTATTASIVSGLLAQEVVKMLHGDRAGVHCLEGAIIVDGSNNDAYPLTYPFDTDCLAHDTHVDTLPLTVDDDTRFSDIFRSVGWADGLVELSGDHLTAWRCTSCKKTHEARGSIRTQNEFTAACPECGASRIPVITTAVSADSDLATERIQPFDLRTDEILRLRGPQGERSVWLQDAGLYPQEWR
jgi:DNA-directed RNA polymerase subunit RPC12/RpoP